MMSKQVFTPESITRFSGNFIKQKDLYKLDDEVLCLAIYNLLDSLDILLYNIKKGNHDEAKLYFDEIFRGRKERFLAMIRKDSPAYVASTKLRLDAPESVKKQPEKLAYRIFETYPQIQSLSDKSTLENRIEKMIVEEKSLWEHDNPYGELRDANNLILRFICEFADYCEDYARERLGKKPKPYKQDMH